MSIEEVEVATLMIGGEPATKSRPRFSARFGRVHTYTPDATKRAEEGIGRIFRSKARGVVGDDRHMFAVEADFYCATGIRRDVDNMLKLILDGLNKIAWDDDHQVVSVVGRKHFVETPNAKTVVRVTTVGVMPNRKGICEHCGVEFPRPKSHAAKKYCSAGCIKLARDARRTRACAHCGTSFVQNRDVGNQTYCSVACKTAAAHISATCVKCGGEFTKPRHLNRSGNSYCSPDCKATYWREQRKSAAKGTCQDCGGPTTKKQYKRCRDCQYAAGGRWADRSNA